MKGFFNRGKPGDKSQAEDKSQARMLTINDVAKVVITTGAQKSRLGGEEKEKKPIELDNPKYRLPLATMVEYLRTFLKPLNIIDSEGNIILPRDVAKEIIKEIADYLAPYLTDTTPQSKNFTGKYIQRKNEGKGAATFNKGEDVLLENFKSAAGGFQKWKESTPNLLALISLCRGLGTLPSRDNSATTLKYVEVLQHDIKAPAEAVRAVINMSVGGQQSYPLRQLLDFCNFGEVKGNFDAADVNRGQSGKCFAPEQNKALLRLFLGNGADITVVTQGNNIIQNCFADASVAPVGDIIAFIRKKEKMVLKDDEIRIFLSIFKPDSDIMKEYERGTLTKEFIQGKTDEEIGGFIDPQYAGYLKQKEGPCIRVYAREMLNFVAEQIERARAQGPAIDRADAEQRAQAPVSPKAARLLGMAQTPAAAVAGHQRSRTMGEVKGLGDGDAVRQAEDADLVAAGLLDSPVQKTPAVPAAPKPKQHHRSHTMAVSGEDKNKKNEDRYDALGAAGLLSRSPRMTEMVRNPLVEHKGEEDKAHPASHKKEDNLHQAVDIIKAAIKEKDFMLGRDKPVVITFPKYIEKFPGTIDKLTSYLEKNPCEESANKGIAKALAIGGREGLRALHETFNSEFATFKGSQQGAGRS